MPERPPYMFPMLGAQAPWSRCPCCNSQPTELDDASAKPRVLTVRVRVNESDSYADRPLGRLPFTHQEYEFSSCTNPACRHQWGHHPTGRWYTDRISEEVAAPLGINVNVLRARHAPMALRQTMRAFTEHPPVAATEEQQVVLFTGAGCSIAVGYPTVSAVFATLPEELLYLIDSWFASAPPAKKNALRTDVEILLDELFRLQNLAISISDPHEFLRQLREGRDTYPSEYRFKENLLDDDRGFYPPLYPIMVQGIAALNFIKPHTEAVRAMLQDVTQRVMETYAEPTPTSAARSQRLLSPLIEGLRSLNRRRSLAIFTTNYDLAIEHWSKAYMHAFRFHDGMVEDVWNPSRGYSLRSNCLSVFYLHGCSRWAIRLPEYSTATTPEDVERLAREPRMEIAAQPTIVRLRHYDWAALYGDVDSAHYPAMLFPSTVKRRYAHSPPFDFAYHQFLHALEHARVLAVVGYSGRDETFKEILHDACSRRPNLHVVILDPSGMPIHYEGVVPPESATVIDDPEGLCPNSVTRMVETCRRLVA